MARESLARLAELAHLPLDRPLPEGSPSRRQIRMARVAVSRIVCSLPDLLGLTHKAIYRRSGMGESSYHNARSNGIISPEHGAALDDLVRQARHSDPDVPSYEVGGEWRTL